MKKFLLALVATAFLSTASIAAEKETLYVLTSAGPGGTYEAINLSVAGVMSEKYDTKVVYHKNCAAAYSWARNNPDKKSVVTYTSWNYIMDSIDKSRSKCNIDLSPTTFTGWVGERFDYLCTYNQDLTVVDFLNKPGKIGVYANPVAVAIVKAQVDNIGAGHKVIPYKGFKATTGAAKSGEVDYLIINSTAKVIAGGGKCLMTAAPAANTDAENEGLLRFEDVITNPALQNTRVQFGLSAFNINANDVKVEMVKAYESDPASFGLVTKRGYTIAVDRNVDEQIMDLEALADTVAKTVK